MSKNDLIKMMLKKYNCIDFKIVNEINPTFADALSNGIIRIVFNIGMIDNKRILLIQK